MNPSQPQPPTHHHAHPWLLAALALAIVGLVALTAWLVPSSYSPQTATTTNQQEAARPNEEVTGHVDITANGMAPAEIRIKKGQTVEWTNRDAIPRQIVSDPHPTHDALTGLNSVEPLGSRESYSFTFETTGTYSYHDEANPALTGKVIVE